MNIILPTGQLQDSRNGEQIGYGLTQRSVSPLSQSSQGGFDPALILQSIRQQNKTPQMSARLPPSGKEGQSQIQQNMQNAYIQQRQMQQKYQQQSSHKKMQSYTNQTLGSTGNQSIDSGYAQIHQQKVNSRPGSSQKHQQPFAQKQSPRTQTQSFPSSQSNQDPQHQESPMIIRKMQDQIQALQSSKLQTEKRYEAAQAQIKSLVEQNKHLNEQLQERDLQTNKMRDAYEDQLRQMQIEIKKLKLRERQKQLDQSPFRKDVPVVDDLSNVSASFDGSKLTDISMFSKQNVSRINQNSVSGAVSARGPQNESFISTRSQKLNSSTTKPRVKGKLELQKLVELYKENPRLERPTIEIEFALF